MRRILIPIFVVVILLSGCAAPKGDDAISKCELPILRFHSDGTFKIAQFTDMHLKPVPESDIAYERVAQVLDDEKPDLVVFTGDIIYSRGHQDLMLKAVQPVVDRGIPFALTFGNHDFEQGLPNDSLYDMLLPLQGCVMPARGEGRAARDYALPVQAHDKDSTAAVVYIFDSNSYCSLKGIGGYDYIHFEQVAHYREVSTSYTESNGGQPLPSLAYMHIPLPEYNYAWNDSRWVRYGTRDEAECAAKLNTGLFAAFREQGDMIGVFSGHDHIDDYAINYYDILLAYGRFSGGNTEYNGLPGGNGARIVVLHEGQRSLDTWIRLADGIEQKTCFPVDYVK